MYDTDVEQPIVLRHHRVQRARLPERHQDHTLELGEFVQETQSKQLCHCSAQ
jgi:hypothetical protein